MSLNVHILNPPDAAALEMLGSRLHPDVVVKTGEVAETADYHVLVAGVPQQEHLAASTNLNTLVIPWAGLPASTRQLLADFPQLAVHNLHHNAAPVAELTLALLLAAARAIVPYDQTLRRGDWRPRYDRSGPSVLLSGKTALVLGYGAIGQHVARYCQALGMEVLATRRGLGDPVRDGVATVYPAAAFPDLLAQAHALIICLPLTPETEGLIGAAELERLQTPSILVNIGRGAIVEEQALFEALQSRRLHAAGIDVWYNYPRDEAARTDTLPGRFPFHELDNVVLSPHRAGDADGAVELRMTHLADLLNALASEQPAPNRVDFAAGY